MTEVSEDEWVVRVRAQVMCRDEGTGGWVALGGGGLANVILGRRPRKPPPQPGASPQLGPSPQLEHPPQLEAAPQPAPPDLPPEPGPPPLPAKRSSASENSSDEGTRKKSPPNYDYFIHGLRISDKTEVLSCTIKKDFKYNKVMPTFHHWVTEEKRFGLTFQTAADARAFDRGVRTAVQELLDGLGGAWPSLHAYKKLNPDPKDDEENHIFECLNLPSEAAPARDISQTPILSAIALPAARSPHAHETPANKELMLLKPPPDDKMAYCDDTLDADNYPYVQLTAAHEYMYPQVGAGGSEKSSPNTKPPLLKRDSGSMKQRGVSSYSPAPPPLPDKKPNKPDAFQARLKCRHCHEWYLESANGAGACEFAPDCFRSCIDAVSCVKCAQCMLYHCMSDAEGDFAMHPCACGPPDEACAKRWLGVGLLSLLVPCLWCYAPLRAAHRAARACRLAGGEHAPRPAHP